MKVISTVPPYAPYIETMVEHPIVSGVRLNTVMAIKETVPEILKRLNDIIGKKDLWIDLKCRQIRTSRGEFYKAPEGIRTYEIDGKTCILDPSNPKSLGMLRTPPWATLKIDRKIKLDFSKGPVKCWFDDGDESAYIAEIIDGDELIMLDGPKKVVGGGESINILDPSLEIEGYLTPLDIQYITAAKKTGIHTYMLSFVENDSDIDALLELDKEAIIIAKIESKKGLDWVSCNFKEYSEKHKHNKIFLMAARGDLYVEVGMQRPEKIIRALQKIVTWDENAIAASRIFSSLNFNTRPACADITDIYCLLQMGYKTLMIGDDICFNEDRLMYALDILKAINEI